MPQRSSSPVSCRLVSLVYIKCQLVTAYVACWNGSCIYVCQFSCCRYPTVIPVGFKAQSIGVTVLSVLGSAMQRRLLCVKFGG